MRELAIEIGVLFAPSTRLFGSLSFGMKVLAIGIGALDARRHRRKHEYYLEYL
jgi:hypothetical protein